MDVAAPPCLRRVAGMAQPRVRVLILPQDGPVSGPVAAAQPELEFVAHGSRLHAMGPCLLSFHAEVPEAWLT